MDAAHEQETIPFIQPAKKRRYLVDFTLEAAPHLLVESKGRFTSQDRAKMLLVKEQNPDRSIAMIFGNASNRLSKKSSTTYGDWCTKNGIWWVDIKEFEEDPYCLLSIPKPKGGISTAPPKKKSARSSRLAK